MQNRWVPLAGYCTGIIAALLTVGIVSHESLRHVVQTAPICIAVVLGIRGSDWTKWAALPCAVFWLLLMGAIWVTLAGWAQIISGGFTRAEIVLTVVVGVSSLAATVEALRMKTQVHTATAIGIALVVAILQLAAVRLSFLPQIARR